MSEKPEYRVSVHTILGFVHREGDILPGRRDPEVFVEGGAAHREIQADRGDSYRAEVSLEQRVEGKSCVIVVSGRADGVEVGPTGTALEEIKSTSVSLNRILEDDHPEHWAQARLYGAMLTGQEPIDELTIRLLYVHRTTRQIRRFHRSYSFAELESFWSESTRAYAEWMDQLTLFRGARDTSLAALEFPFEQFRTGQRSMAERVYRTLRDSETLFLEAPTGIGKTMGVLYPSIKALGSGHTSKIFYLTAKTVARTVAEDAVRMLIGSGAKIKSVTLTAKGKICFLLDEGSVQRPPCDPEVCPFARGHFSRVDDALSEIFCESLITRDVVEEYARKHTVCPFEFSLDISNWADIVIGDYNYAFDPRVQLQRFFQRGKSERVLLVDEAHNLVDRGRSMFSASISKYAVLRARKTVKDSIPQLAKATSIVNSALLAEKKQIQERYDEEEESLNEPQGSLPAGPGAFWIAKRTAPDGLEEPLRGFLREFELTARTGARIPLEILDLYFELRTFLTVLDWYGDPYLTLYRSTKRELAIRLACIDPSPLIGQTLGRGRAAVFFSATLEPMQYFISLLAGNRTVDSVALDSPFPRNHLCLIVDPTISTKYRKRIDSYDGIAERIETVVAAKRGNYLVFFPSYAYAEQVRLLFSSRVNRDVVEIVHQRSGMTEAEREQFLELFHPRPAVSVVGFVVMGGIFAEGIDLQGDRLTGALVVGPGLPQIGPDRDIIRHYFDEHGADGERRGFDYAYTYPGFNRVQQAAGRVIRTEEDRGVVLLIDDRFGQERYQDLFPPEWNEPIMLDEDSDLQSVLQRFWTDE